MQSNILNSAEFFEKIEFFLFNYINCNIFSFSFYFSHNYLHKSILLIKKYTRIEKLSYTTKYEVFNVHDHDESLIFFIRYYMS